MIDGIVKSEAELGAEQTTKYRNNIQEWVLSWHEPMLLGVAGDLTALNGATAYEAALEYAALGWSLITMNSIGEALCGGSLPCYPEHWEVSPMAGIGFGAGLDSGVVGLWIADQAHLEVLEAQYGPLPFPRISGKQTIICFRAPSERYPARTIDAGIAYLGEGDFLPVPPTISNRVRLQWQTGEDITRVLPALPAWLSSILASSPDSSPSKCP